MNQAFENIRTWMEMVNSRIEKIELYEQIIEDRSQPDKVIDFLKKEIGFLQKDQEEIFNLVRSQKDKLSKFLILKYFEGYSTEEAALALGFSVASMNNKHADFIHYMKHNEKPPVINRSEELKKIAKSLEEALKPKYTTCCQHCGKDTVIPKETARKMYLKERRKERATKRKRDVL